MDKIKVRCTKCGLVLKVSKDSAGKIGKCPRCSMKFRVPGARSLSQRKDIRAVIEECENAIKLLPSLSSCKAPPACQVIYTEVSPIDFALNRKNQAPLLDLSEGGLSFYLCKDVAESKFLAGELTHIEIDSPIFILPICCEVETRWIKPTDTEGVMQVGISFNNPDKDFLKVIDFFVTYIMSKADLWEAE